MAGQATKTLPQWAVFLAREPLPVLQSSLSALAQLREDENTLSAQAVARVVLRDPMLTAHLLRYLQQHRSRHQQQEIVEVEQALLMLGLGSFYEKVVFGLDTVEQRLAEEPIALENLKRVLNRLARAANYAREWAVRLNDRHYGEVYVATLLHDLAEAVLWAFSPEALLQIRERQIADRGLRSHEVQEQVLGFTVRALQRELIVKWGLPELLVTLMDDEHSLSSRVRCVTLAINLARHSGNGWEDAALPDDYRDIGQLLRMPVAEVRTWLIPDKDMP